MSQSIVGGCSPQPTTISHSHCFSAIITGLFFSKKNRLHRFSSNSFSSLPNLRLPISGEVGRGGGGGDGAKGMKLLEI